jgi:hypothetical protein
LETCLPWEPFGFEAFYLNTVQMGSGRDLQKLKDFLIVYAREDAKFNLKHQMSSISLILAMNTSNSNKNTHMVEKQCNNIDPKHHHHVTDSFSAGITVL